MDFMLDQVFTAGGDALARAYASRELYEHLVGLPKLGPPEVLDRQEDGDQVRLQIRYRFVGDLSPAVTAVVDPRKLTWVEHSVHDLVARTLSYRLARTTMRTGCSPRGRARSATAPTVAVSARSPAG